MARNLLPTFRTRPNPANIAIGSVGHWNEIADPIELSKLSFGQEEGQEVRNRIQSIPSPWARILLFKTAMEDSAHPARSHVEHELLDALEFLWSSTERPAARLRGKPVRLSDLEQFALHAQSERVEWLAHALSELRPALAGPTAGGLMERITVLTAQAQPLLLTSPFTLLATTEDAGEDADIVGAYFQYARGAVRRTLQERPFDFQRFVAQVLLPQLESLQLQADGAINVQAVQRTVLPWIREAVAECRRAASSARRGELDAPRDGNWQAAAASLRLEPLTQFQAGVTLYARMAGSELAGSRWRLRPTRQTGELAPIILDRARFDGHYYAGAPVVTLPAIVVELPRDVLPGLGTHYPWVHPEIDWFADRLIMLGAPVKPSNCHGYSRYSSRYTGNRAGLGQAPQIALPLKGEVLRHFSPADLDERLSITVDPSGTVEVTLRIPVGDEGGELHVTRRYDETAILVHNSQVEVAVWPRLRSPGWKDYAIARLDADVEAGRKLNVRAWAHGSVVEQQTLARADGVWVSGLEAAPDAIEFEWPDPAGRSGARYGLLLPKYADAPQRGEVHWDVGVDFGTSNTAVSIRTRDAQEPTIFGATNCTLLLTELSEDRKRLLDSFFFPEQIADEPFGTAVMHFHELPNLELDREPVALRVNIPFSGQVEGDNRNRVRGDLKWAAGPQPRFLTATFLRHLLGLLYVQALEHGVAAGNVHVRWAYPRAFTPTQINQMQTLWVQVKQHFEDKLGALPPYERGDDESRAVLRYLFNSSAVTTAADVNVVIDIGGGTSDIAMYGHGRSLALDSVMLGGRNLTGARAYSGTVEASRNQFVARLIAWARSHGLADHPREAAAVAKYSADGQDHLAFTYLVRSRWFERNGAPFSAEPDCHRFQLLVLYLYSAVAYYAGLSLRGLQQLDEDRLAPSAVLLAGNGIRYMRWLTDLTDGVNTAYREHVGRMLMLGMSAGAGVAPPSVRLSKQPKLEVALGLAGAVEVQGLAETSTVRSPVIGEQVTATFAGGGVARQLDATTRVSDDDIIGPADVANLRWAAAPLEIELFNKAFVTGMQPLLGQGAHWRENQQIAREALSAMQRRDLEQRVLARLQLAASEHNGFRGSLFVLEASAMLDLLSEKVFA